MPKICVVGAGRMGSAIARTFLRHGHQTYVWNRTAARCEPLLAMGALTTVSLAQAIAASDVVASILVDYAATDDLLRTAEVEAALKGKLVVQFTSGSPDQAREAENWAARVGAHYLDAAIMATPDFIDAGQGTVLYAGQRDLFDNHTGALSAIGGQAAYVGADAGLASSVDAALLAQMWGALFGVLQAAAVIEAEGIDPEVFELHFAAFKPVVDAAVIDLVARIRDRRFSGDDQTLAGVSAHHAAFGHLIEICAARGLNPVVVQAFDSVFRAAINAGWLQGDFAALAPFMISGEPVPEQRR